MDVKVAERAKSTQSARNAKREDAFDEWLQRELHAMFDKVAREPVPDELLRMIEADRVKRAARKPPKDDDSKG